MTTSRSLRSLERKVTACHTCPRLVTWREQVAREKRAAYARETYWGKPVSGFGDSQARLMIVGLAPGAHGANRTGRVFTGDRSGEWLYRAIHKAGFSSAPESVTREDGLQLEDAYVTAIVRCAPPANKPTTEEKRNCLPYFHEELDLLNNVQAILALGSFAWDGVIGSLRERGHTIRPKPKFGHGHHSQIGPYSLFGSYHPSQQNTFTKKLTEPMLDEVFQNVRASLT